MDRSVSDPFGDWPDQTGTESIAPVPPADPTPDYLTEPEYSPPPEYGPPAGKRRRIPWWTLGVLAVVLFRFGPGWWEDLTAPERDEAGGFAESGTVSSLDLQPGDCFTVSEPSSDTVEMVDVVPCAQPHVFEAYAHYMFPDGKSDPYPGEGRIVDVAQEFCLSEFDSFVGITYEDSALYLDFLYPVPEGWAAGDRVILCVITPITGTLTGSMAGAAR